LTISELRKNLPEFVLGAELWIALHRANKSARVDPIGTPTVFIA